MRIYLEIKILNCPDKIFDITFNLIIINRL